VTQFNTLIPLLVKGGVRFILVGGAAAVAHGSSRLTNDLDIMYERSTENIRRIIDTLDPYQPYLRGAPPGLPFRWETKTLATGHDESKCDRNFWCFLPLRQSGKIDSTEARCRSPEGSGSDRRIGINPRRNHQIKIIRFARLQYYS
jgi:hypothetical protein